MASDKSNPPSGEKIYICGPVEAGAVVQMGEHITNIQQMFPRMADGEFLAQQFKKLVEEIGAKSDLDEGTKEWAVEKTEKVAAGIANAEKQPKDLQTAVVDANKSFSGKISWIWDGIKKILTSDAAKQTYKTIAETGVRAAIKAVTGV